MHDGNLIMCACIEARFAALQEWQSLLFRLYRNRQSKPIPFDTTLIWVPVESFCVSYCSSVNPLFDKILLSRRQAKVFRSPS